jgi:hypothetical protein
MRREVLARSPLQSEGEFALLEQMAKVNFAGFLFGEEIPLPVDPGLQPFPRSPFRELWRDVRRLMRRPDFGPPVLADPPPPPA